MDSRRMGMNEIGKRIKVLRIARGIRQLDLARQSGVQRTYIALIETGELLPTHEQLARIKAALDWPADADKAFAILAPEAGVGE